MKGIKKKFNLNNLYYFKKILKFRSLSNVAFKKKNFNC